MLSKVSLGEQSTKFPGNYNIMLVRVSTSMSKGTSGRIYLILFASIRCPCRATICVGSKWRNPVPLYNDITIPMFLGSSQVCFATHTVNCGLVPITNTGVALQPAAMKTHTSASVVFRPSIENRLGLDSTTFFEVDNMRRILS